MRLASILVFLICLTHPAVSQTFSPLPGPVQQQAVAFDLATECFIFFENPDGDTLRLRWKKIEVSHPENWTLDLCDFGLCYVGIPPSGLMNPATGDEQPYLKLIVQPGQTPGAAWLWFRVWADGDPANFADVFFDLYTPGTTSAPEAPAQGHIRVFPNPTSGPVLLENPQAHPASVQWFDVSGRLLWQHNLPAHAQQPVDLSAMPRGMYVLKSGAQVQRVVRQ